MPPSAQPVRPKTRPAGTPLAPKPSPPNAWKTIPVAPKRGPNPHADFIPAYQANKDYCSSLLPAEIVGTALLVPPSTNEAFIGCLYTSKGYGRAKDAKPRILEQTRRAMTDMLNVVAEWNVSHTRQIEKICMCQINSGLFSVDWTETARVLEEVQVPDSAPCEITVVTQQPK